MKKKREMNEEDQYYHVHQAFYKGIGMWAGILIVWLFIVIKEALTFRKRDVS